VAINLDKTGNERFPRWELIPVLREIDGQPISPDMVYRSFTEQGLRAYIQQNAIYPVSANVNNVNQHGANKRIFGQDIHQHPIDGLGVDWIKGGAYLDYGYQASKIDKGLTFADRIETNVTVYLAETPYDERYFAKKRSATYEEKQQFNHAKDGMIINIANDLEQVVSSQNPKDAVPMDAVRIHKMELDKERNIVRYAVVHTGDKFKVINRSIDFDNEAERIH
jgi:hypothetical protein